MSELQALVVGEHHTDVTLFREALHLAAAAGTRHSDWSATHRGRSNKSGEILEVVPAVAAALELLRQRSFDLVLLDVATADRSVTILRELREFTRRLPVLVLAAADDSFGVRVMREGAQDVIPRDEITARSLARAISFAVERHRSSDKVRRREEQLRLIADSLPVLIAYVDADQRYRFNNAAYERWLGIRRDALVGRKMSDVLGEAHFERIRTYVEAALRGEKARYEIEVARVNGENHWWDAIYLPHILPQGRVAGFYALVTDTTPRKRAEEILAKATHAAEAANRAKTEFLANMSHEIRTPMTAILGFADVLSRNLRDPDNLACVDTIRRNGRYLIELIGDVLDLSKIEAGRLQIERRRIAPDELVIEVRSLMEVRAREKNLPLLVEFSPTMPQTIESDPTRLRQILVNLVSNAIKFTDEGMVRLVTHFHEDPVNPRLQIDVVDTGVGISEDQFERIFAPFTQADMSETRKHGGTGLGLTISRRLATMLGGEITVASTLGKGSTFSLTVTTGPLDGVPLIQPRTEIAASPIDARPRPKLRGRILVVDDRRDVRFVAQHILEEAGAEVVTAENGAEALAAVQRAGQTERPIDIIVMDMQMPVMDGYEATTRLRNDGFRRPIIALTTYAMRGDREKCLRAGCDDYASKPIDAQRLIELIAHYTPVQSMPEPCEEPALANMLEENTELDAMALEDEAPAAELSNGRRILVVDDNPDVRQLMHTWLEMSGHHVRTAEDGRSALKAAEEQPPEFMVLDLSLPDISGYEVVRRLRMAPEMRETMFIALSGHGDAKDRERSREVGFSCHLQKPVNPRELEEIFARSPVCD